MTRGRCVTDAWPLRDRCVTTVRAPRALAQVALAATVFSSCYMPVTLLLHYRYITVTLLLHALAQVALAATVFSSCTLSRAVVLGLLLLGRRVGLGSFFAFSILLPELLPTIAALLVLRRRACPPGEPCAREHANTRRAMRVAHHE